MRERIISDQPVKIEKLVPGGQGIGTRADGKKGFFWNALPGEIATEYQITKEKSSYFEAVATKIEQPSAHRIAPKDDCFLSTSPWQIMDYSCELTQKSALLVETFRQAGIDIVAPTVITDGADFFYRNKMEYALYWNNETEKIELAFHARGSHRKIPIIGSSIEKPALFEKASEIVAGLNARHEEARKYQSLLLRVNAAGEVSGGLYENGKPHPVFDNLTDSLLGQTYSYSPNGFFQINLPVYELALKEIREHISTDDVLDLYSGVGTIGLSVAGDKNLTLVESNPDAYRELAKNASACCYFENTRTCSNSETNGRDEVLFSDIRPGQAPRSGPKKGLIASEGQQSISERLEKEPRRVRPIHAKSEDALSYIAPAQTVILDPPRAGCDKTLIDRLNDVKPEKIIYLSCNPTTQARDVKLLEENYKIQKLVPFNFFPRTPHLENLVILELR